MMRPVRKASGNRLTAMMQVRNEADRYLETVLRELSEFVDDIVVVDDASSDGTPDLCRRFKKVSNLVILSESLFGREWMLRSLLWKVAVSTDPDWLLAVDADEVYEDRAKERLRGLIDQDRYDWVGFRMFDFWGGMTHYREDEHWNLHRRHMVTLVRFLPGYHYFFPKMDLHVPRIPLSYRVLPGYRSELRIKHFGWVGSPEQLRRKYERYVALDPEGRFGNADQYRSILDPNPRLVEWKEDGP
ncbi:MAG: glycosyltransferase family 2 protein [Kyrpidia sp.]|nr:glycosyltransferase family 2 protein [Kyrpidia sp.]